MAYSICQCSVRCCGRFIGGAEPELVQFSFPETPSLHPRFHSHNHTWKLPSKTTVWSAGHRWPLNVWPRIVLTRPHPDLFWSLGIGLTTSWLHMFSFYATAVLMEYGFYGEEEKRCNSMLSLLDGRDLCAMCFLLKLWLYICAQADYSINYRRQI